MITAIVLYDLPPSIGFEECRAYFTKIAPGFFKIPGFLRRGGRAVLFGRMARRNPRPLRHGAEDHLFRDRRADRQGERTGERPRLTGRTRCRQLYQNCCSA